MGIAFFLIIATSVLAPLAMALAVRSDASWRPTALVSLAAAALFVVFLLLPWGNASFLMAVVTLFACSAVVAARLRAPHAEG
jgi:Ca2+/Na+ antiporter